jgi:uncharacterized coiled-coil protein SlyX
MAEEFVRIVQFGEFVKRIEERFDHLGKELVNVNTLADQRYDSINQRLADAEKARDQNAVHVNQRFDDMNRSVNQRFDDMDRSMNHRFDGLEKLIAFQNKIVLGILGVIVLGVVKYLFFPG